MATLRLATPADAQRIHELLVASFSGFREQYTPACFDATVLDEERVRQRIAEGPVWVVEDDDVIATVGAKVDDRGLYIRGMAVHPDARRRGLGQVLLRAAESYARTAGLRGLWLSTTTFLEASQALYRRFGFVDAPGPADLGGTPLVSFEKCLEG